MHCIIERMEYLFSTSQLSNAALSLIGAPQSLPNLLGQFGPDPHALMAGTAWCGREM